MKTSGFFYPLMDIFINIIIHHEQSKGYFKHVSSLVRQILLYIKHPATKKSSGGNTCVWNLKGQHM